MLWICSPTGQEEFFIELSVPVATRTTRPPRLDGAAQAEFKAKAAAIAPKYRTELLQHTLKPAALSSGCGDAATLAPNTSPALIVRLVYRRQALSSDAFTKGDVVILENHRRSRSALLAERSSFEPPKSGKRSHSAFQSIQRATTRGSPAIRKRFQAPTRNLTKNRQAVTPLEGASSNLKVSLQRTPCHRELPRSGTLANVDRENTF